jgi:hypothetical protein
MTSEDDDDDIEYMLLNNKDYMSDQSRKVESPKPEEIMPLGLSVSEALRMHSGTVVVKGLYDLRRKEIRENVITIILYMRELWHLQ